MDYGNVNLEKAVDGKKCKRAVCCMLLIILTITNSVFIALIILTKSHKDKK